MADFRTLKDPSDGKTYRWDVSRKDQRAEYDRFRSEWLQDMADSPTAGRSSRFGGLLNAMTPDEQAMASEAIRRAGPSVAAGGAAALTGGLTGMAGMTGLLPALLRMGAAAGGGAAAAGPLGFDPAQMAKEEATSQGLGEVLSGIGRWGGKALMRSAIEPPLELSKDFPGTWNTAAQEHVGVGNPQNRQMGPERAGWGERMLGNREQFTGSAAVKAKLEVADQRVQQALARAGAPSVTRGPGGQMQNAAPTISAKEIVAEVKKRLLPKIARRPTGTALKMDDLVEFINDFEANHPGRIDVAQAHELKRGAQAVASPLLDTGSKPLVSDARALAKSDMEQEFNREIQAVVNEWLGEKVPGYRALEKRAADLIGLKRALEFREASPHGLGNPRLGPGGVFTNPLEMLSPQVRTTIGRGLLTPAVDFSLTNLPRGLWATAGRDATGSGQ